MSVWLNWLGAARRVPTIVFPPPQPVDDFDRGLYIGLAMGAVIAVVLWHLAIVFG